MSNDQLLETNEQRIWLITIEQRWMSNDQCPNSVIPCQMFHDTYPMTNLQIPKSHIQFSKKLVLGSPSHPVLLGPLPDLYVSSTFPLLVPYLSLTWQTDTIFHFSTTPTHHPPTAHHTPMTTNFSKAFIFPCAFYHVSLIFL